jgi:hypothetical protein
MPVQSVVCPILEGQGAVGDREGLMPWKCVCVALVAIFSALAAPFCSGPNDGRHDRNQL